MEESFPLLRKFLVSYLAFIDAVFIHRCSLTPISNTTRLCVTRYEKILIWAYIWESMYPISVYSVWIIYAYETSNTRNFHEEFMEFFRIIVHTEGWRVWREKGHVALIIEILNEDCRKKVFSSSDVSSSDIHKKIINFSLSLHQHIRIHRNCIWSINFTFSTRQAKEKVLHAVDD